MGQTWTNVQELERERSACIPCSYGHTKWLVQISSEDFYVATCFECLALQSDPMPKYPQFFKQRRNGTPQNNHTAHIAPHLKFKHADMGAAIASAKLVRALRMWCSELRNPFILFRFPLPNNLYITKLEITPPILYLAANNQAFDSLSFCTAVESLCMKERSCPIYPAIASNPFQQTSREWQWGWNCHFS